VQATTRGAGGQTFTWGTAVRNSDGSIYLHLARRADCGAFDTTAGTVTVKVAVSKLNQFASKGAISTARCWRACAGRPSPARPTASATSRAAARSSPSAPARRPAAGCAPRCDADADAYAEPDADADTRRRLQQPPTPTPTPTPTAIFNFDSAAYARQEDCVAITVRVLRTGVTNTRATVDIASNDGTAKQKGDYTFVVGRLVFESGETQKTFQVLVNEDAYVEGTENATLVLQNPRADARRVSNGDAPDS
jgi:hypothetical protein